MAGSRPAQSNLRIRPWLRREAGDDLDNPLSGSGRSRPSPCRPNCVRGVSGLSRDGRHKRKKPPGGGFGAGSCKDYLILVSLNSTCLRATGSYFLNDSLSVLVRAFFL